MEAMCSRHLSRPTPGGEWSSAPDRSSRRSRVRGSRATNRSRRTLPDAPYLAIGLPMAAAFDALDSDDLRDTRNERERAPAGNVPVDLGFATQMRLILRAPPAPAQSGCPLSR